MSFYLLYSCLIVVDQNPYHSDNYSNAVDTVWGGWKDSDIRSWLVEHGYLRSDAQVKRDEMVKLINSK